MKKLEGIVKWFNNEKGYGFITYLDNDVFIHYSNIIMNGYRSLDMGDIVEFNIIETSKGYQGLNVCKKRSKQ